MFANGPAGLPLLSHVFRANPARRNSIRGDGFFAVDLGVSKRWQMPWSRVKHTLQFRWEVFNVTNSNRFNIQTSTCWIVLKYFW